MMLFGLVTGKTTISLSGASPLLFVGEIMKKYAVRQIESKEKFCCEITVKRHDVKQILQEASATLMATANQMPAIALQLL